MSKFWKDLRVGVLGATAGVFSVSLFLLVARVDSYYSYLKWLQGDSYGPYDERVEDLWWIALMLGQVALSVLASLVVHGYLGSRGASPFLLWQAIGFGSLIAWGLAVFLIVGVNCIMNANLTAVERALGSIDFAVAKYVSSVIACHVLFGTLVQSAVKQYEEPVVDPL